MPTAKTSKSALKRFKISGTGKVIHRKPHQDHYNARAEGSAGRLKRKSKTLSKEGLKNINHLLPYNR